VGRTNKKYALDKPTLPSLWHVQARINFNLIEVVALEEVGFLLSKKPRCPLVNQVGNDNYARKHGKVYTKSSVSNKILRSLKKRINK
jgi:hypothetical protein